MKKADLILTSDWHLRESVPVCRTDDFWTVQWAKVEYIHTLQRDYECSVLHAGDLFHHWKPSPYLLSKTIQWLPKDFWTIYGQHDLPQHNWELKEKSGIFALQVANILHVLGGAHWGREPGNSKPMTVKGREIMVWHKMVWQGRRLWPGQTDPSAIAVLKKYPEYDLILTGDNHKPFVEEYEGRLLVNPGSLTRQSADQIDHRPRVYLYDAEQHVVWPEFIPIESNAVSRMHLEERIERDNRIEAFISKLAGEWEAGLSFETNIERFLESNKVLNSVKEIIYKSMDNDL